LLTYRVEGDTLVTDQPSDPREESTPFKLTGEALSFGASLLRRKPRSFDPLAPHFAIAAAAVAHALRSAHPDGPFVPFLMATVDGKRRLHRFVAADPKADREAAQRQVIGKLAKATAVAYSYDGFITSPTRIDAALVEVSVPGADGLLLAQPYR